MLADNIIIQQHTVLQENNFFPGDIYCHAGEGMDGMLRI